MIIYLCIKYESKTPMYNSEKILHGNQFLYGTDQDTDMRTMGDVNICP